MHMTVLNYSLIEIIQKNAKELIQQRILLGCVGYFSHQLVISEELLLAYLKIPTT
jgi:hypothetical protein